MSSHTRINTRAVIQNDNKVLLCHFPRSDKKYFFFPGGGVEFGEGAEEGLRREMREELGVNVLEPTFIGAVENVFPQDGKPCHELNVVFSSQIDNLQAVSQEEHIGFIWMPIEDLEKENVLPQQMVFAVTKWLKDKKVFWVGLARDGGSVT